MCPKCDECSHIGSTHIAPCTEGKSADYSCVLTFATSPHLSTSNTMSESSAPTYVYRRRKLRGNSVAIFSAQVPESVKRSGDDCPSVASSDASPIAVKEQYVVSQDEHAIGATIITTNGCSLAERVSDESSKNSGQGIIEVDSMNDSCSSSKSDMELVSAHMQTVVDNAGECSSSSVMVVEVPREGLSEKDLCVSIMRSQGVLEGVWPNRTRASAEDVGDSGASSNCRSCKICAYLESTLKMIICDNCEDAFHLSCCNPRLKRIPPDDWFCHSCSKKCRKILKESISRSPNMIGEKGRCGNYSTAVSNPIALMLRDTGLYTSGVRIGKGFQAEVPDWSGPITKYVLLELKSNKPSKLGSIGNWLQCKELIDGEGESANGTICGKWRRAPLFEVQTDDWECFCSFLWDPIHADCAVPQELDTDKILQQLKYIQMVCYRLFFMRKFGYSFWQ
uniref:PHD-type domain-containing protein n=1 Tax=Manihot esculenta TaxID=3983 RepID=A0A2C9VM65_MANES